MQIGIFPTEKGYACYYLPNCWSEVIVSQVDEEEANQKEQEVLRRNVSGLFSGDVEFC